MPGILGQHLLQPFPTLSVRRIPKATLQGDDLTLPRRLEGLEEFRSRIGTSGQPVKRDVRDPVRIIPDFDVGRLAPPSHEVNSGCFKSFRDRQGIGSIVRIDVKATLAPVRATSALMSVKPFWLFASVVRTSRGRPTFFAYASAPTLYIT